MFKIIYEEAFSNIWGNERRISHTVYEESVSHLRLFLAIFLTVSSSYKAAGPNISPFLFCIFCQKWNVANFKKLELHESHFIVISKKAFSIASGALFSINVERCEERTTTHCTKLQVLKKLHNQCSPLMLQYCPFTTLHWELRVKN